MPDIESPQNEEVAKLLEPISEELPCGEELWMAEGRHRLQQPLDDAVKVGEQPEWPVLRDDASELMTRTHDLRIAVLLCLAFFKTRGLVGFRDGLTLIHGVMEKFWDHLHPMPEDATDPIRSNILSNLAAPPGSNTPYQFVKLLREAPLCHTASGAEYSLADLDRADSGKTSDDPEATPPATREQIEAALRASPEKLRETSALIAEINGQVEAIEVFASSKFESVDRPDFARLNETLARIIAETQDPDAAASANAAAADQSNEQAAAPAGGPGFASGGAIRSRADADAALAAVCDYFRRHEPSSPVPYLVDRARRMLKLDFMAAIRELAPGTVDQFHPMFGTKEPDRTENQS